VILALLLVTAFFRTLGLRSFRKLAVVWFDKWSVG